MYRLLVDASAPRHYQLQINFPPEKGGNNVLPTKVLLLVTAWAQVAEVYRLLVDASAPLRRAAAELVSGMLAEQGARFLAQVGPSLRCRLTQQPLRCRWPRSPMQNIGHALA